MIKDPLPWFLLAGVVLFSANHIFDDRGEDIVVDSSLRAQLVSRWRAQMHRDPTSEELAAITRSWLEEEVMYREAVRLNLADDDTIIRRRLVQKVGFLIEDVAEAHVSDEDIASFYRQHSERYIQPERVSFQQVLFATAEDASAALASSGPEQMPRGPASLVGRDFVGRSKTEVNRDFGPGFYNEILEIPLDVWSGPIRSRLGTHLVKVESIDIAKQAPLVVVVDKVRVDLLAERKRTAREAHVNQLLEAANVVFEE